MVGYTPYYWIIQNSHGIQNGDNGNYYLEMGNTLGICADINIPIANKPLRLKPSYKVQVHKKILTNDFAAIKVEHALVVGVLNITNTKGEKLTKLAENYYFTAFGRE